MPGRPDPVPAGDRRRPTVARGGIRRALLGGALAVLLASAGAVPATAADPGAECPPAQPNCNVWDDDPGTPGGGGNGGDNGGGGNNGGGGGGGVCQWQGRTVACYHDELGWFNSGDGCYYKLAESPPTEPQPGKQWYVKTCWSDGLGQSNLVLLDAPPPGFGAPPDPEELARRAFASITLLAPRASVAPRKNIGPGLVGLPVWMWAERGVNQFGPLSASATDRGLTVTIRAEVDQVVWEMGNGDTVACTGPGTRYDPQGPYAGQPSPDCGYHSGYAEAGEYTVQATTHWSVTWTSNRSHSGSIAGVTRTTGPVAIQINELQVVAR